MTKRCAIMVVLVLAPMLAGAAGWSWTNAWEHQRFGRTFATECYEAVSQRCEVVDAAIVTAPTWYRFQRTNLQNDKDKLEAIIPSFADTNESSGGDFDFYFADGVSVPVHDFPMLTVTGVLAQAGLPSNYLDHTPWRCLNGLGPPGFTNDTDYAVMGRAYGWTNATTAAGGTNFPAGRTRWDTCDYGWHGIQSVADQLVWTRHKSSNDGAVVREQWCGLGTQVHPAISTNCCGGISSWWTLWDYATEWSEARAVFNAEYSGSATCIVTNYGGELLCEVDQGPSVSDTNLFGIAAPLTGNAISGGGWFATGIYDGFKHSAQCYPSFHRTGATYTDYFQLSASFLEFQYGLVESFAASSATNRETATYSPDPMISIPAAAPYAETSGQQKSWYSLWLYKWNVTDGFDYQ